jgi:hypothetical protein
MVIEHHRHGGERATEGKHMNTPDWLKPGLIGALTGGIVVAVAGFAWAGWMTAGGADRMARSMAAGQVIAAFVPMCVEMSANDPERAAKLAVIQEVSGTRRRDAMMATGWATIPGALAPSRDLATACVNALELPAA